MAKRHKSIGADREKSDGKKLAPVTFDLQGEDFNCKPRIAGSILLEIVGAADEGPGKIAGKLLWFIEKSMDPEEYVRFREFVDDADRDVEMEDISDIVEYLIEEYSSRPTPASSSSASGRD